jgi:nicotinate phosphoribosyltransferase
MRAPEWITDERAALFTDLYQLTMLQAYHAEGMRENAVFELFVRRLVDRNYLIFSGLDTVLHYLETLRFAEEDVAYLASLNLFEDSFLEELESFRFTGSVLAVPEGTPVFAGEPLLQVEAPIAEAQLVETFILNQITFQTNLASKASRVVCAAGDARVIDFGARRIHGTDAALRAARAAYVAGAAATSNVLAGRIYGIPVAGTMAHSYVQAHDDEDEALLAFARMYPNTTLLVDTYDTLAAVERLTQLARTNPEMAGIGGIRLDSGDLAALAHASRRILNEGGLKHVRIVASGSLDEFAVRDLVRAGAPIDAFGVGTAMGTIADRPFLDSVYKLVSYGGQGRMKLSTGKRTLPGLKQIFREEEGGRAFRDTVGLFDEDAPGRRLLTWMMRDGVRTEAGRDSVDVSSARNRVSRELACLPKHLLGLEPVDSPYPVHTSTALTQLATETERRALTD